MVLISGATVYGYGHRRLLSKTAFRCKERERERVSGKPMAKFIEDAEVLVLSIAPLILNQAIFHLPKQQG